MLVKQKIPLKPPRRKKLKFDPKKLICLQEYTLGSFGKTFRVVIKRYLYIENVLIIF